MAARLRERGSAPRADRARPLPALAAGAAARQRRRARADATPPADGATKAARLLGQLALAAFVVVCLAYQRSYVYTYGLVEGGGDARASYFTLATLAFAVVFAAAVALVLHRRALAARIAALAHETRSRRIGATVAAALFVLLWLSSAYNTDGTVNLASSALWSHFGFWTDEAFAILGGHAPLVDFQVQYGQLWAYLAAGGLELLGASLGVYAAIMVAGTTLAMTAVFDVVRRVAGSSLLALALFAPFVATSFFLKVGPLANRYSPAGLFDLFPMRYGGPLLLLWAVVRRTERDDARAPILLFAAAGLVAINNVEFGIPALGATVAALLWTMPQRPPAAFARLAAHALAGLALAVLAVCALTLAVAASLPDFGMLATFPRIFGIDGFGMLPMPPLGTHLVVYVTFAAALVLATVRAVAGERDRLLTAALAWAGVFGLGAGAYFAGRSHPHVLIDLFCAWMLALTLLVVATVRAIAARPSHRPTAAELLVLFGLGLAVCSLPQTPTPWSQIERLKHTQPHDVRVSTAFAEAVRALTHRGEPVALLLTLGQRIAYEDHVVDVNPYANAGSMLTRAQWADAIAALRRAHGTKVIASRDQLYPDQLAWLARAGYRPAREVRQLNLIELSGR
ncbi:MAG TPA: hypothetical protein VFV85_10300 [Conexibacter sp.]|nr:hypothetical protein [Conexibacter sp.]